MQSMKPYPSLGIAELRRAGPNAQMGAGLDHMHSGLGNQINTGRILILSIKVFKLPIEEKIEEVQTKVL